MCLANDQPTETPKPKTSLANDLYMCLSVCVCFHMCVCVFIWASDELHS